MERELKLWEAACTADTTYSRGTLVHTSKRESSGAPTNQGCPRKLQRPTGPNALCGPPPLRHAWPDTKEDTRVLWPDTEKLRGPSQQLCVLERSSQATCTPQKMRVLSEASRETHLHSVPGMLQRCWGSIHHWGPHLLPGVLTSADRHPPP